MTRRFFARPALAALLLVLAGLVWAADQSAKQWALREFSVRTVRPFIGELLQFTLVFNPGAAFSLGTDLTPVLTLVMATVSAGILVAMTRVGSTWWAVALGLLLGGALGNLTDRLLRPPGFAHGHVVDFLMLPNFPVFNVADSFITTAAALILVAAWKDIPFSGRREGPDDEVDAARGPGRGAQSDPREDVTRG